MTVLMALGMINVYPDPLVMTSYTPQESQLGHVTKEQ
jgi:hypothetical protein